MACTFPFGNKFNLLQQQKINSKRKRKQDVFILGENIRSKFITGTLIVIRRFHHIHVNFGASNFRRCHQKGFCWKTAIHFIWDLEIKVLYKTAISNKGARKLPNGENHVSSLTNSFYIFSVKWDFSWQPKRFTSHKNYRKCFEWQ